MTEHRKDVEPDPRGDGEDEPDDDHVIPADQTAPGVGEVEIGGESLDP